MLKGQEDKYYTKWFNVSIKDGECGAGYFGITKKYSNILSTNCHEKVQNCLAQGLTRFLLSPPTKPPHPTRP